MTYKVLAVSTSSGPTLSYGQTGLWLSELTHFTDEFLKAGHQVDVVTIKGGKIPLDVHSISKRQLKDPANVRFMDDAKLKESLENSVSLVGINSSDYDLIYLAGGHGTMWDFKQSPELQKIITEMNDQKKIITAVCHGVCGLLDSVNSNGNSLIKGKRITGFSNFEDRLAGTLKQMPYYLETELKKKEAIYEKNFLPFTSRTVEDGNIITGQNPQSAKALALHALRKLS